MKNLFKSVSYRIGFLAIAMSLSLTSCNWFTNSPKSKPIDSNKIDSPQIDSPKTDSPIVDSNKIKLDSDKIKH
jgi:hypothetical protein